MGGLRIIKDQVVADQDALTEVFPLQLVQIFQAAVLNVLQLEDVMSLALMVKTYILIQHNKDQDKIVIVSTVFHVQMDPVVFLEALTLPHLYL